MGWEIVRIPEKPPSSIEQATVDVFASAIEPKFANTLVRQLNQVAPLENLCHVKRVRKKSVEGRNELLVILCFSSERENQLESICHDVLNLIGFYKLCPFVTKVAKYAATSKVEWENQCKLWPTSYHPSSRVDDIGGFCKEDSQWIFNNMKLTIKLTKLGQLDNQVVNAAVIVDPSSRQIIASATDQTSLSDTITNTSRLESSGCIEQAEIIYSPKCYANELANNEYLTPELPFAKCIQSYTGVSCLYPWKWPELKPSTQKNLVKSQYSCSWHPLRHAALAAIESSADRDRRLFPSLESLEHESLQSDDLQCSSITSPAKRPKIQNAKGEEKQAHEADPMCSAEMVRPYLCTGFDIYLAWEPCTMCAMSLIHQRIRRIFYAFPNPNAGALGSVHTLQGEKSLNHHYSVFRILLPEDALHEVSLTDL